MWDRIAGTACLAATLPVALVEPWIVIPWAVLCTVWVVRDHKHTKSWTEIQVSVLTQAEKDDIARRVAMVVKSEITETTVTK